VGNVFAKKVEGYAMKWMKTDMTIKNMQKKSMDEYLSNIEAEA
jgi:hypothetical protein